MAQTATTEPRKIEFQLELSLEQYGIVKLLAKLQGTDLLAYIHQNLKDALPGLIDNIEDEKEREQARADYGDDYSSMGYERKILLVVSMRLQESRLRPYLR
jgi:hypothetical protein